MSEHNRSAEVFECTGPLHIHLLLPEDVFLETQNLSVHSHTVRPCAKPCTSVSTRTYNV